MIGENIRRWLLLLLIVGTLNFLIHLTIFRHIKIWKYQVEDGWMTERVDENEIACSMPVKEGKAEDILCMKPKEFLQNFKNPCWYDYTETNGKPIRKLKCLPYFYIFGVCKTGTTDLYQRMVKHPQILENRGILNKETWFWSWDRYRHGRRKKTFNDFINTFKANEIERSIIESKTSANSSGYSNIITGHADPMDFWDHRYWRNITQNNELSFVPRYLTPHLVHHVQPNIKLIVILREPSERLYSHYYFGGYGENPISFHNDVVSGLATLQNCLSYSTLQKCIYGKKKMKKHILMPISASLYNFHLKEWLNVFAKEQILVLRTEDYDINVGKTLQTVFKFLDVDAANATTMKHILDLPRAFQTSRKTRQGSMYNDTRKLLLDFFKEPNRQLSITLRDDRFLWNDCVYHDVPAINRSMVKQDDASKGRLFNENRSKWLHERIRVKRITSDSDGHLMKWWDNIKYRYKDHNVIKSM